MAGGALQGCIRSKSRMIKFNKEEVALDCRVRVGAVASGLVESIGWLVSGLGHAPVGCVCR